MKKVGRLLVALVLLLNVSFGYTLTITFNAKETTSEVEGGQTVTFGLSSRKKANYVVDRNNATLRVYGNRRQFVMPEANVDISVSEIKKVADMKVGDYVTYYPLETAVDLTALTGFEHEILNPSLTTEWRVLSNDGTKVELVSEDSVGNLTLSQAAVRTVSGTFSRGSEEIMEQSKENYANVIWILNRISRAYANPQVTNGWRGLGYNGTSEERITTEISHAYVQENSITGEPYRDSYKLSDVTALMDNDMLHSDGYACLASRTVLTNTASDTGNMFTSFYARRIDALGNHDGDSYMFHDVETGYAASYDYEVGIRPVISLKLDTEITGSGTSEDKWVIQTPSSYTMADMRVGDYVKYYPNENMVNLTALTGFEHETLNAATTEEWRVLSIDSSTGEVELVSADSVVNLTLGKASTRNSSGIFSNGSEEIMEASKSNYVNAIYILNTISKAYEKEGVTSGSRGLGYNGTAAEKIDTDTHEISYAATGGNENFVSGEPYRDSYKVTDLSTLKDNNILHSDDNIWITSRTYYINGTESSDFRVRGITASGDISSYHLFGDYANGNSYSYGRACGICPVVRLQSGITISGSGTSSTPWVLNN